MKGGRGVNAGGHMKGINAGGYMQGDKCRGVNARG